MAKFKTASVKFEDSKYNYETSINPNCTDENIKKYFVGVCFNVGFFPSENMQKCISCNVLPAKEIF